LSSLLYICPFQEGVERVGEQGITCKSQIGYLELEALYNSLMITSNSDVIIIAIKAFFEGFT
jgi:hypothetical protein